MATVLSAALFLGASPAAADARQDFLDQYHARGAYQIVSDEMLIYWGTMYCHDQADGNGALWRAPAPNLTYSTIDLVEIADQTLCP
ncbi:hypothetical protein K3U94_10595 [Mycolicibacter heraklionensis]|uniref:DUF732 domain-containing protein n=1 Tax=Mycolicibacter heraklionensis TaxID=512402 RepID=A0A9X7WK43_9MYCO|nr:hypothetical protein [Mycolicibacter heraklionensis]QZA09623.1 hypothetical protein K3U94_10595 [Mycolicibacter heraklionensis]